MKNYISDQWDMFEASNWDSNMLIDFDAGIDISPPGLLLPPTFMEASWGYPIRQRNYCC